MRVYRAVDRPDLAEDQDYVDPVRRQAPGRRDRRLVAEWVGERTLDEVMAVFEEAEVAAAPVYDARAAARRRASAGAGLLRRGRRPRPRADDGAGPGGAAERDARAASTTWAGRSAPTTTPSTASCSASTPNGSRHCETPGSSEPTIKAGGTVHRRARRSELATPASSERMCEKAASSGADLVFLDLEDACAPAAKEAARGHRGRCADRAGLGSHRPRRAHQRARHALVPRRHHRGRHRGPRRRRRADRAEGAHGPRRVVGRRAADPARDQARPDPAASGWRSSSRRRRDWPTRSRSPRRASAWRR